MNSGKQLTFCSTKLPPDCKVFAFGSILHSLQHNFEELVLEFEQLYIESENYKTLFNTQKIQCDSESCTSSKALMKVIAFKDNIIQLVLLTLTKLNETKNLNLLSEAFQILRSEIISPEKESQIYTCEKEIVTPTKESVNLKKELTTLVDVSVKDDSVSEIEGTPTGRTSPIIQSKKLRNSSTLNPANIIKDIKKKCPDTWSVPENKALKLSFTTPTTKVSKNGKMRQSRLNLIKVKRKAVVDLSHSPVWCNKPSITSGDSGYASHTNNVNIKIEIDDTVLPSPTSEISSFSTLYKTVGKNNPVKLKPLLSDLKIKTDSEIYPLIDNINIENKKVIKQEPGLSEMDSNNILRHPPGSFVNSPKKKLPRKVDEPVSDDMTLCETNASISLLNHDDNIKNANEDGKHNQRCPVKRPLVEVINFENRDDSDIESSRSLLPQMPKTEKKTENIKMTKTSENVKSPIKHPLAENINFGNCDDSDIEQSMSLLPQMPKTEKTTTENVKTKTSENVKREMPNKIEPQYKEPTIRKKAEKMALPGWSCRECKDFYGVLYKDDPVMLKKKIEECSRHRGRWNPTRPKTPPGFWELHWNVPEDTEEFNKRNDAI